MAIFKKEKEIDIVVPQHIAIIMDGNGRWAKKRGLPRTAGHKKGANNFRTIADYMNKIGVKYMTFYAFSTENWRRSKEEVDTIMALFKDYLEEAFDRFKETDMKLRFIGDRSVLNEDLIELMHKVEDVSKDNTGAVVNIAINYGGRQEVTEACKQIAQKVQSGELQAQEIDEQLISNYIFTAQQPDPDLIIRPSGEFRLSNFMIWQCAYSEFWFDNVLWPDFSVKDLDRAIKDYSSRQRRFGGVK
ncbi:MAG: isoprenyl transferase [Clostridia bacterium]|nr:isoprenyl transferase [Clostridia bacterium]